VFLVRFTHSVQYSVMCVFVYLIGDENGEISHFLFAENTQPDGYVQRVGS
jgi:hypothetical protein